MAARSPCWLCDEPINYALTRGPEAFQLDHAVPVSVEPRLALATHNFRPSHAKCNNLGRDGKAEPITGEPSEDW